MTISYNEAYEKIARTANTALDQMFGNLPQVEFVELKPGFYWLQLDSENAPCMALIRDNGKDRQFWEVSTLGAGEADWALHNFDLCDWWGPLILHKPTE